MSYDLDAAMWSAWQKIADKILSNDIELRRRLDRRAKTFDHVPRSLCLAIKASDRRISDYNAWLSIRNAMDKGYETEHDVLLVGPTIKDLCRPVQLHWRKRFGELAYELGSPRQAPRQLERRGVIRCYRVPLLDAQRGLPVPLVDSPVPATAPPDQREWQHYGFSTCLDPCARGYRPPDMLLAPYWEQLWFRIPDWFEQLVRRKPIFSVQRGQLRFMHWVWICPECKRSAKTIYFPLGAPDFARMHDIQFPAGNWYDIPQQRLCLACQRCHHLFGIARTPNGISTTWSLLIAHMSGGLLFGREVPRPASFAALRPNKPLRAPRPSPRRDELEAYLAQTDLPLNEIARRMAWTRASITRELHYICKRHHIPHTRPALQEWWSTHQPRQTISAA